MKKFSLKSLHPIFETIHFDKATYFSYEWMDGLYESVDTDPVEKGIEILVNKKRKKQISSIQFDVRKVDMSEQGILSVTLKKFDLDILPLTIFEESWERLKNCCFSCSYSEDTKMLKGLLIVGEVAIEVLLMNCEGKVIMGSVDINLVDNIVNGAQKKYQDEVRIQLTGSASD